VPGFIRYGVLAFGRVRSGFIRIDTVRQGDQESISGE
jgi:hypothetical protein